VKDGKCPKCGSDQVFRGTDIPAKTGPFGSNSIPITLISIAALNNYVCADCGYLERYVASASKLQEISRVWPKVKKMKSS
jgi:predicted nucleic-acid-binding Zn-ribbon protein